VLAIAECLFCGRRDGGFTSREHIFPESLTTDIPEAILPPGVVCDRCNNGPLASLDEALCDFLPLTMRRLTLGITNKRGQIPTVRGVGGRVEPMNPDDVAPGDSHGLRFVDNDSRRPIATFGPHGKGRVDLSGGRRLEPRYISELSRALLKIGFEQAFLDHGASTRTPGFRGLRERVLGIRDHHGIFATAKEVNVDDCAVHLTYGIDDARGTLPYVVARVFGITLVTVDPFEPPSEEWANHDPGWSLLPF
jgi:hypothetical protein